jgi:hypothetical protein
MANGLTAQPTHLLITLLNQGLPAVECGEKPRRRDATQQGAVAVTPSQRVLQAVEAPAQLKVLHSHRARLQQRHT